MRLRLALLVALVGLVPGCFARNIDQKVFDQSYTSIVLRSYKRGFTEVEQGYEHPFVISPARATHILAAIDIRKDEDGGRREPAIPTESLYLIGEGLSRALAEANENQEVVVMSIRRSKSLAVFDRKHLTSFVAFRKDDRLHIHLDLSDWPVPPYRSDRLPEPEADGGNDRYAALPGKAIEVVGPAAVSVAWRDPLFSRPTRIRVMPGGRVVRREILMEAPEDAPEAAPEPAAPPIPANLTPETLRALADLEDRRRRGELTETEYEIERRRILAQDAGLP